MRVPRLVVAATLAALAGCGTVHGTGAPAANATRKATITAKPAAAPKLTLASANAGEVLARAKAALAGAKTVHVFGAADTANGPVKIDIRVKANTGAAGTVTQNGARIEMRKLGEKMYFHAPAAVWGAAGLPANAVAVLAGKWVLMPASALGETGEALLSMTTMQGLTDALLVPLGTPKKTGGTWPAATIRGVPTIKLTDNTGGSLYVATSGAPYPVRITDGPAATAGQVDLIEYNKAVTIAAPPAAQVFVLPTS